MKTPTRAALAADRQRIRLPGAEMLGMFPVDPTKNLPQFLPKLVEKIRALKVAMMDPRIT
jgi:hypothetical protein